MMKEIIKKYIEEFLNEINKTFCEHTQKMVLQSFTTNGLKFHCRGLLSEEPEPIEQTPDKFFEEIGQYIPVDDRPKILNFRMITDEDLYIIKIFTFHVSRFTFYVSRTTFHVLRIGVISK